MATATIDTERLASITFLAEGAHSSPEKGMCAMEAAAYIANEPFSDHPNCVSPVIATFMRSWNDALPDDERTTLLLPLIPKTIGTADGAELETRRAMMAADWLIRTHTPAWLRLAGLTAQADMLASLPEITDMAQAPSIMPALTAVRNDAGAARAAAMAAARDAAWAATSAWDAARAAASDTAWAAASAAASAMAAARAATSDAACDAARAAARDAACAWAAAGGELSKTRAELQQSAAQLIERMCEARS